MQVLASNGTLAEDRLDDAIPEQLVEGARAIGSSLDLPTVLRQAVDVVAQALGETESCIYLLEEESDDLVLAAGTPSMAPEHLGAARVTVGEGVVGWVGASRETYGPSCDDLTDGGDRPGRPLDLGGDAPGGVICTPLVSPSDRLVGVVQIAAQPGEELDEESVRLVEWIAAQAATALDNALRHDSVVRKAQAVERMAEVSAMTTSGLATARMLDGVTELAREASGAEVAITVASDPAGGDRLMLRTVDTASSAERRERVHAIRRELTSIDAQIRHGGTTWPVAAEEISSRLRPWFGTVATVPLRVAGEALGVMCCYRTEGQRFTGEEHSLLATIASQAALALKGALLTTELTQQKNEFGHFVREITAGRPDPSRMRAQAAGLGLDDAAGYRFVVGAVSFDHAPSSDVDGGALVLRQVAQGIGEVAPDAHCAATAREIVALVPSRPQGDQLAQLRARLRRLVDAVEDRVGARVTFGVSQPTASLDGFRAALTEAREVLAVAARGAGGVFTLDDVSHRLLLRRAADVAAVGDRYSTAVEIVAEYDRVNNSELLHTLGVFLHVRSRNEAARVLYVHRNTLAQRLRRIEELTGLGVSDAEEWFPLQLALEIHLLRHPRRPTD